MDVDPTIRNDARGALSLIKRANGEYFGKAKFPVQATYRDIFRTTRRRCSEFACAALLVVCPALPSDGAQPEGASSPTIPGTTFPVAKLLLLPGQTRVFVAAAPAVELCIDGALMNWYRGAGLRRISGRNPFMAPVQKTGCAYALSVRGMPFRDGLTVRSDDCTASVRIGGGHIEALSVQVSQATQAVFSRCLYRMGLFLEGYNGTLSLPRAELFIPTATSIYDFDAKLIGPDVPMIVRQFRRFCGPVGPQIDRRTMTNVCKQGSN